ncbi:MAG: nuclear transport factor 2 family protein [Alphaproteobacteria bacterium]|nr:nuclear transport factor 2 family protein [Alphaproteobacteria bacterium]
MADIERWVGFISSRDGALLGDLLHPDVVLETPFFYPPRRGRDQVRTYLLCSMRVLCGPGFGYIGQWRAQAGAVLEFESVIDGIRINGVEIIGFDEDGRITRFRTMVRPLRALEMLSRLMAEQLQVEDAGA